MPGRREWASRRSSCSWRHRPGPSPSRSWRRANIPRWSRSARPPRPISRRATRTTRSWSRLFKLTRRRKIPSFNICYSMQLFALVHGGKVVKNPAGKEVGFREVRPTPEGREDPVIGNIGPYTTLQWHGDVVEELPEGAVRLASSRKTKNQVAVLDGIHYMVQADGQAAIPAMVRSWLRHDAKWATQGTGIKKVELDSRGGRPRGLLPEYLPQDLRELPSARPPARSVTPCQGFPARGGRASSFFIRKIPTHW